MLKIKENIDLKELEKFGFEHCGDFYKYDLGSIYTRTIIIYEPTRIIETDFSIGSYELEKYNDIIYDLIKADMVEKVEE